MSDDEARRQGEFFARIIRDRDYGDEITDAELVRRARDLATHPLMPVVVDRMVEAFVGRMERGRRIEAGARALDRAYGPRSVGMTWTVTQEMIRAWRELQEALES